MKSRVYVVWYHGSNSASLLHWFCRYLSAKSGRGFVSGIILVCGTRSVEDVAVASANSQISLIYAHSNLSALTGLRGSLGIETQAILPSEFFGNITESISEITRRIGLKLSGACPFGEVSEIAIGLLIVASARANSAPAPPPATAHPT
jgi:hypothetical protein